MNALHNIEQLINTVSARNSGLDLSAVYAELESAKAALKRAANPSGYTVLSIGDLKRMLKVAKKISAKYPIRGNDLDCMVYEGRITHYDRDGDDRIQFSIDSARIAGSNQKFEADFLYKGELVEAREH